MYQLILYSYAKLNLYLEVLNRRRDAYHNIKTLFERIDLRDKIILKPRRDNKIKIFCNNPGIPRGKTNLCYRSAKLLQETFNIDKGLDIRLIKNIPVGAGLGGGSGNAAAILLGLNKLWKLRLSKDRLVRLSKLIGCDVPFFIYETPFALGTARGDRIKPLNTLDKVKLWHILAVPQLKVLTAVIYKEFDKFSGLTRTKSDVKLLIPILKKARPPLIGGLLFNSLETVTLRMYPRVRRIKDKLLELGLKSILMSGSGPAVFSIVSSRKEAEGIARQLEGLDKSWRVFVAKTF